MVNPEVPPSGSSHLEPWRCRPATAVNDALAVTASNLESPLSTCGGNGDAITLLDRGSDTLAAETPAPLHGGQGEYSRLKGLVEAEGLLRPQHRYYLVKIGLNAVLLGLGLLGLRLASMSPA